jgi:hypothetical protein
VVYTRIGGNDQAFDKGHFVTGHSLTLPIEYGKQYSFKITAVNRGGESSRRKYLVYARCRTKRAKYLLLTVLPGFLPQTVMLLQTHYSEVLQTSQITGFPIKKTSHTLDRSMNSAGLFPGWMMIRPDSELHTPPAKLLYFRETRSITLWFTERLLSVPDTVTPRPACGIHCRRTDCPADGYFAVDLILGKQKQIKRGGTGPFGIHYQAFSPDLQHVLAMYAQQGGNMIISGAYVATDIWDGVERDSLCIHFAEDVLKFKWRSDHASESGEIIAAPSPFKAFYNGELSNRPLFRFNTRLNSTVYAVESPDALEPSCPEAFTIFRYKDNRFSAGVAYRGPYSTVVLGFPIETLSTPDERAQLVSQCLYFFNTDK